MPEATPPKHVVMLVDNAIVGDSRVQKEAMAIAARGWKVTLVGRRPRAQDPENGRFLGVRARFAYVAPLAGSGARLDRTTLLRSPLAYPTRAKGRARDGLSQAAVVAAGMAIDELKATGRDVGARRYLARARMARARWRRRVVERRLEASAALRLRRKLSTGLIDRAAIRWWTLTKRKAAWAKLDPGIWDWELGYGPLVDKLKPDLIHANDHRMLAVGARAMLRARGQGRPVKLVYDAHEWLEGLELAAAPTSWLPAQVGLERAFVPYADAVVTVSDVLAEMLQTEHALGERPTVVCNAPLMASTVQPEQTVREVVGLAPEVPLLVYSGAISPERSVDTVIRALPQLPEINFVMVVKIPFQPIVHALLSLAAELGVADRVHTAPYVPVEQIVPYLAAADVGIHPLIHGPNNEIALATKFYEYAQARLPILVTDVKVMSETTRRTGQGEVFTAGDPADLVRAARLVFDDLAKYRKAFDDEKLMTAWTWEAQADVLDSLYRRTLGLS